VRFFRFPFHRDEMHELVEKSDPAPGSRTEDMTGMADCVRSLEGRAAIERGRADIREGRLIAGENALAGEVHRRAAKRRRA
jgi:hypothetical protein